MPDAAQAHYKEVRAAALALARAHKKMRDTISDHAAREHERREKRHAAQQTALKLMESVPGHDKTL